MKFEVGQEFEFEALYRDDTSHSNFGFTIIKRTPKMITVKFDSKRQQEQRFRINERGDLEFIVINHISGFELVTSRSIYAKNKK